MGGIPIHTGLIGHLTMYKRRGFSSINHYLLKFSSLWYCKHSVEHRMSLMILFLAMFVAVAVSAEGMMDGGSPAVVRITQSRIRKDGLEVEVKSDGKRHHLTLTKAESIWAKDAQTYTFSDDGKIVSEDLDPNADTVYHDIEKGSVVSVNGNEVEGIIDHELTIRSFKGDHFVFKANKDIVYGRNDYIELPGNVLKNLRNDDLHDDAYLEDPNVHLTRGDDGSDDGGNYTEVVVPPPNLRTVSVVAEILVVVDSRLASYFTTLAAIRTYLSVFYNAVNREFATMSSPTIRIELVGQFVATTSTEPFILPGVSADSTPRDTIYAFSEWMYTNYYSLGRHDIAYLQTARDMYSVLDGQANYGLAGVAFLQGACFRYDYYRMQISTGMGEDLGAFYSGVHTATHEIAHNLGAPHDGSGTSSACPWGAGYIMTYTTGTALQHYFSNCSEAAMTSYVQTTQASCLWRNDAPNFSISSGLPGYYVNMDEQCKKLTGRSNAFVDGRQSGTSLCTNIVCRWIVSPYIYTQTRNTYALDGSSCKRTDGTLGRCNHWLCA